MVGVFNPFDLLAWSCCLQGVMVALIFCLAIACIPQRKKEDQIEGKHFDTIGIFGT